MHTNKDDPAEVIVGTIPQAKKQSYRKITRRYSNSAPAFVPYIQVSLIEVFVDIVVDMAKYPKNGAQARLT